ncbi:MAG: hypothetical protein DLM62_20745 [Pseudonocardiales bacterium]|nr:MAG: hypothetical protein DLM62_20745 [Pseudonocardiales bacterium]
MVVGEEAELVILSFLAFFVAEPAVPMLGVVQQAVVAAISTTVAVMTCSVDGGDYSAADQQAHQRRANYGSGPMPHDNAHTSAHPRSPSPPLSHGLGGGHLATRLRSAHRRVARFGDAWLIWCAHHYLLLPYPLSGPMIPTIRWSSESGLRKRRKPGTER